MPRNQYGRADINFRSFFQDFNMSKFVVYTSLLIFSMLFAFKKDGLIHTNWWYIFIPLFVWKGIAGKIDFLKIYHATFCPCQVVMKISVIPNNFILIP